MRSDPPESVDLGTEALYREFADCDDPEALDALLDVERRLRALSFDVEPDPEPGARDLSDPSLGRFEHQDLIGRGGQSLVFRAIDPRLDREVAIKVHSSFGSDGMLGLRRLVHEARALAHLDLPGVVRIYDAYEEDGRAFVVMESVDGPPLSELIDVLAKEAQPRTDVARRLAGELEPIEARCRLVRDLARSLFTVHERGVVHRDVKPSNVLVERGPAPKWIDFGLSHKDGTETDLTSAFLIGTPAYISPEQVKNRRTGASALSDQFSLGVLFYELLTLENPFKRDSREETLDAIATCAPPAPRSRNPRIPREVERIVLHMLEPVPQARYEDAAAVAADLDAFLQHRPISVGAPTLLERLSKFVRRNAREVRLGSWVAGLMVALAVLLFALDAYRERAEQDQRLRELLDGLTEQSTHVEAYATFKGLDDLLGDVQREERRWMATLTPGSVSTRAGLYEASERLARTIGADEARHIKAGRSFRASEWRPVLDLELELCPECTANAEWRDIGAVRYVGGLEGVRVYSLAVLEDLPFPVPFDTIPIRRLDPGLYRAERRGPSGALEREHVFLTGPGYPPVDVLAKQPSQVALDECVRVSFGGREAFSRWASDHGWAWAEDPRAFQDFVQTRDFRIHPRPVTWREIEAVFGLPLPERVRRSVRNVFQSGPVERVPEASLDDYARVTPLVAHQYAARIGMRLPTPLELAYALDHDERLVTGSKEICGWPASVANTTSALSFVEERESSPLAPWPAFMFPNDGGSIVGETFRVASSL